ncbi:MAG: DUF4157 domain-containing protein [Oscillatoria sp. SIO1A7]|nr:DUF4157 domain-containing protein [Oscillatoria sp. SIO1A7]
MRQQKLKTTQTTVRSSREGSEIAKPVRHPVLQLQADIGNRATSDLIYEQGRQNAASGLSIQAKPMFGGLSRELLGGNPIQAKLTLGAVGDKYEQEADRVAAEVASRLNRSSSEVSPESQGRPRLAPPVQTKTTPSPIQTGEGGAISSELEGSIKQAKGSGSPLPKPLRSKMEEAFGGADFGEVKVHTGAEGDRLNRSIQARAFTTGQDIFFRQGEYRPEGKESQALIAHELVHVQQQNANHSAENTAKLAGMGQIIQRQPWSFLKFLPEIPETLKERIDPRRSKNNKYWQQFNKEEIDYEDKHPAYHSRERHGAEHDLENIRARTQFRDLEKNNKSEMINPITGEKDIKQSNTSSRFATPAWHTYSRNKAIAHIKKSLTDVIFPEGKVPEHLQKKQIHSFYITYEKTPVGFSVTKNTDEVKTAYHVFTSFKYEPKNTKNNKDSKNKVWLIQHYPEVEKRSKQQSSQQGNQQQRQQENQQQPQQENQQQPQQETQQQPQQETQAQTQQETQAQTQQETQQQPQQETRKRKTREEKRQENKIKNQQKKENKNKAENKIINKEQQDKIIIEDLVVKYEDIPWFSTEA